MNSEAEWVHIVEDVTTFYMAAFASHELAVRYVERMCREQGRERHHFVITSVPLIKEIA